MNRYDARVVDAGSYHQRRSYFMGLPPSVGPPSAVYGRGGTVPYTVPLAAPHPSLSGRRGVGNGFPPFEPGVRGGFNVGVGVGGGGGRGSTGFGSARGGRMNNGGFDAGSGRGGRGFESGRGGRGGGGGGWGFDRGQHGDRRGGGGGFDSGHGGGRGGRSGGSKGDLDSIALPTQDFGNLVPFEKNFYFECPSVSDMNGHEVAIYRGRREITVEGHNQFGCFTKQVFLITV